MKVSERNCENCRFGHKHKPSGSQACYLNNPIPKKGCCDEWDPKEVVLDMSTWEVEEK